MCEFILLSPFSTLFLVILNSLPRNHRNELQCTPYIETSPNHYLHFIKSLFPFSNFRRISAIRSQVDASLWKHRLANVSFWFQLQEWSEDTRVAGMLLASHLFFSFFWLLLIYLLTIKADLLWIFLLHFLSHWQKLCMLFLKAHFILNRTFLFWWPPFFFKSQHTTGKQEVAKNNAWNMNFAYPLCSTGTSNSIYPNRRLHLPFPAGPGFTMSLRGPAILLHPTKIVLCPRCPQI